MMPRQKSLQAHIALHPSRVACPSQHAAFAFAWPKIFHFFFSPPASCFSSRCSQHAVATFSSSSPSSSFIMLSTSAAAVLQVRKQILEAFDKGTIQTRAAYIALEHEWMHLETLAYMLAQEQRRSFESSAQTVDGHVSHEKKNGGVSTDSLRRSFERSAPTANGNMSHVKENGGISADSSSTAEVSQRGQRENGHRMVHSNGHANDAKGMVSNGDNGNGGDSGSVVVSASHDHGVTDGPRGVTNGTNGHMHLNGDHVTPPVSTLTIPAGDVTLGIDMDPTKNFVWDNEGPKQSPQHVSSFHMAARPVSNAEFYHFAVECNGYEEEQHWTAADMSCLKKRKQCCPATWTLQVAAFKLSLMVSQDLA